MKIGICFSGQGSQSSGMLYDIYKSSSRVQEMYRIAQSVTGINIAEISFNDNYKELLNQTIYTQPCVLAADLAALIALQEKGIEPDVIAGFSVGEIASLFGAGVLSLEEVFKLVKVRAEAMQRAVPIGQGIMAAVTTNDINKIENICINQKKGYVEISNYNSNNQIVLSGETTAVNNIVELIKKEKARVRLLPVSAPFHCKLMKPAAEELSVYLEKIDFNTPKIPIIMNVNAEVVTDKNKIKENIILQSVSAVLWKDVIYKMKDMGVDLFIECGPGRTLSKFTKNILPQAATCNVFDTDSLEKTQEYILGM